MHTHHQALSSYKFGEDRGATVATKRVTSVLDVGWLDVQQG